MINVGNKQAPHNKKALELLDHIRQHVAVSDTTTEILAFVKIGREYHRFSTGIVDVMRLIAMLEVAKYDCISRMSDD